MLEVITKSENVTLVLAALLAISEALALIPGVQSNSVFQLITNGIKKLSSLFSKPKV